MFRSLIVLLVMCFVGQSASAIKLEIRVTSEDHPTEKATAPFEQTDFNVPKGVPPKTRTVEVTGYKKLSLVTAEHKDFTLRSLSEKDEREFLRCFKRCSADAKLSLPGRRGLIALFDLSQQRREDLSPYHGLKVISHDEEILDGGEVHVKRSPDRTVGFVFLGMTPPQEEKGHRPLIHGKKMIFPLFFVPVFPPDMEGGLQRDVIQAVCQLVNYLAPFSPVPISRPLVKSTLSPSEPLIQNVSQSSSSEQPAKKASKSSSSKQPTEKDAPSSSGQKVTHAAVSLDPKDSLGLHLTFSQFEKLKTAPNKPKADPGVSRALYLLDLTSKMSDSDFQSFFNPVQTQKISTLKDRLAEDRLSKSLGDVSVILNRLLDEDMNNQAEVSDQDDLNDLNDQGGDTTVEVSNPFALFSQHTLSPFITEQPASTTSAVPPICRSCSPLLSCTPLAQCISACFSGFCGTRALSDDTLSSKDE